ncbi:MAG: caspase family protein, partial [Sediminibacterium sp.]|nr:caspase family protein [Sediminibacterium sp.]
NKDTRFPDKINIVYNFNDLINRSEKIFECSFNNDHPPDPELTLADLDLNLPDEVKAIVFNQPKTIIPAIVNSSNINFKAANNTKAIVANEKSTINFTLINSGKGSANNLKIKISDQNNISGLSFTKEILLSNLEPNSSKDYSINIAANLQVPTNTAKFHLEFEEQNGFYPAPIDISIPTLAFAAPKLQIVDYSFVSNTGKLEKSQPIILKALLQNLGQGEANNIAVEFKYPTTNVFNTSVTKVNFNSLKPNETKELLFEFVTNKNYTEKTIPITIKISEQHQQFAENKNIVANLSEVVNTSVALAAPTVNKTTTTITTASLSSDVDKNIPINVTKNPNKYALIIGNEDYSSRQTNLQKESNVPFAINDAKTFKDYCLQTLGIEEENIFFLFNATAGEMAAKIELVTEIIKRLGNKSELIVYYAGHGFPDDKSKAAYLIPVDVNVNNLASAIKLSDFYQKLSKTNAKKITVFLDACFTGGAREEGLIAGARGIKIVPNEDALSGNLVVFSATTNDQSALPYRAKQHGIFTYFLLKALQNSQGKINFANLEEYLKEQVTIQSLKVNAKAQDPSIRCSNTIKNIYLNWTL